METNIPQADMTARAGEGAKTADGGTAFPGPMERGLSVRDYFIAHAPAEPQAWFAPVMETPRPTSEPPITSEEKRDGEKWDRQEDKQRYVQWPAAWADEMLKARTVA